MIYPKRMADIFLSRSILFLVFVFLSFIATAQVVRQKLSINNGWRFYKGDPADAKGIFYDVRPKVTDRNDNIVADTRANQTNVITSDSGLKKWILPSVNDFIKDPSKHFQRPEGKSGIDVSFVQFNFDDSKWEEINLPHDWAIKGPFYEGDNAIVGVVVWVACQFRVLVGIEKKSTLHLQMKANQFIWI